MPELRCFPPSPPRSPCSPFAPFRSLVMRKDSSSRTGPSRPAPAPRRVAAAARRPGSHKGKGVHRRRPACRCATTPASGTSVPALRGREDRLGSRGAGALRVSFQAGLAKSLPAGSALSLGQKVRLGDRDLFRAETRGEVTSRPRANCRLSRPSRERETADLRGPPEGARDPRLQRRPPLLFLASTPTS